LASILGIHLYVAELANPEPIANKGIPVIEKNVKAFPGGLSAKIIDPKMIKYKPTFTHFPPPNLSLTLPVNVLTSEENKE
jgi:hypothetical protein